MDVLAIGCLLALFRARLHQIAIYRRLVTSRFAIVLPALIIIVNNQTDHPQLFFGVGISLINVMIAFCIDWSVTNYQSMFGRFLNSAPMVRLGMMSYSLYLWQQPFLDHNVDSLFTTTPYNLIGLSLAALFSYHFVEKYSLVLRHKWEPTLFDDTTLRTTNYNRLKMS
jgi:peptidoglycan/LPS O-acetylase OafA/YrhL